jgi:hypothetical protein
MGHRASYAIRAGGNVEVFYSHWGALTVPQDIFWGPEHAEEFIRLQVEGEQWLDDVFGEGGVALDKDTRTAAWYGGETLTHPPIADAFVPLMEAVWRRFGWNVRHVEDMPDIAEQVGLERAIAEAEPLPPSDSDLRVELEPSWALSGLTLLTTVVGGRVRDVVSGTYDPARLLLHGPALLVAAERWPDVERAARYEAERELNSWEQERRSIAQQLAGALLVDVNDKRVLCYAPRSNGKLRRAVAGAWEGSTVEFHEGGLERHFAATGRSVPDVLAGAFEKPSPLPIKQALDAHLDEVVACLMDEGDNPGPELIRRMLENERDQNVQVNPLALQPVVRKPMTEPERMRIVSVAVADLLGRTIR